MHICSIEKNCVGCGACVDICPRNALQLELNEFGFYRPAIIEDKCVECKKCIKVCPEINSHNKANTFSCFYGWSNNEEVRNASSSGGIFSELSQLFLNDGGVVFGAAYSHDNKSICMSSSLERGLDDLRRSKYCQSRSNRLYHNIDLQLKLTKKVILTGTPCQIAAARLYFGDHPNLLLVDFMCGGVAPETAYRNYIESQERTYGAKVRNVNFRYKGSGWKNPKIKIQFENGKTYLQSYKLDYYYYYYCTKAMKNDACTTCRHTQHQGADITIADFWGYHNVKGLKDDGKGISLICAYTAKGREYIDKLKTSATLVEIDSQFAAYAFHDKSISQIDENQRRLFLAEIRDTSFIQAAKNNYFKGGMIAVFAKRLVNKIKMILNY